MPLFQFPSNQSMEKENTLSKSQVAPSMQRLSLRKRDDQCRTFRLAYKTCTGLIFDHYSGWLQLSAVT